MKVLLLFSTGKESVFSLHQLVKQGHEVTMLLYDYGQDSWMKEHEGALYYSDKLNSVLIKETIDLHIPQAIRFGENGDDHVVFRNGIFLSLAVNIAVSLNYDAISIGATKTGDHGDGSVVFYNNFKQLIKPLYPQIKIISPTSAYSGYELFGKVMHHSIDSSHLWSCMRSEDKFCMECSKCRSFIKDFESGTFKDFAGYKNYLKFAEKFYGLLETR